MKVLVFNAGSSSLKFGVFDTGRCDGQLFKGSFQRFRDGLCTYRFSTPEGDEEGEAPHAGIADAIAAVPEVLKAHGIGAPDAVGNRIAHGGDRFAAATVLDDGTLDAVRALTPLAPLHNPANLEAVDLARGLWPEVRQASSTRHSTSPTLAAPRSTRRPGRGATRGCAATAFTARPTGTWPKGLPKRSASPCTTSGSLGASGQWSVGLRHSQGREHRQLDGHDAARARYSGNRAREADDRLRAAQR